MDAVIDLEGLPWQEVATGARAKICVRGSQRVRLVEFVDGFVEPDWCTAGHGGQVLEGACTLLDRAGERRLQAGDVIAIPAGDESAHKAVLGPGERVLLLLFENV